PEHEAEHPRIVRGETRATALRRSLHPPYLPDPSRLADAEGIVHPDDRKVRHLGNSGTNKSRSGCRTAVARRNPKEDLMKIGKTLHIGAAAIAIAAFLTSCQSTPQTPGSVGANDLGGVVTSANGPEAGVWVIAETTDLPTKFAKLVVTDDRGRYLVPDLPKATYSVWVRGYGLVDSAKVRLQPGTTLALKAAPPPSATAAADDYPPTYWYSMINIPAKSEFPG